MHLSFHIPPILARYTPKFDREETRTPSEIRAASESTGPRSALDMEEIGLLRTAVTPARQVNSLPIEHQYASSRALTSAGQFK